MELAHRNRYGVPSVHHHHHHHGSTATTTTTPVQVTDNGDGTVSLGYLVSCGGEYDVGVGFRWKGGDGGDDGYGENGRAATSSSSPSPEPSSPTSSSSPVEYVPGSPFRVKIYPPTASPKECVGLGEIVSTGMFECGEEVDDDDGGGDDGDGDGDGGGCDSDGAGGKGGGCGNLVVANNARKNSHDRESLKRQRENFITILMKDERGIPLRGGGHVVKVSLVPVVSHQQQHHHHHHHNHHNHRHRRHDHHDHHDSNS